jgi:threonine/homoserine/homoserine lactone efflux protein
MIQTSDLLLFALACLALVVSPGPNMVYLISRSITQGKIAGLTSLGGIVCGFFFHIIMVSFGLTAVLFAVPLAYTFLKTAGTLYLLYLAYQAVKPANNSLFEMQKDLSVDKPAKLFSMGFFTSVLNPKVAVFYLSFFPQFIKPENGSVMAQSLQLGITQMLISFTVNLIIVLSASRMAGWFSGRPLWVKIQKWFMASILTGLALKMALDKK